MFVILLDYNYSWFNGFNVAADKGEVEMFLFI